MIKPHIKYSSGIILEKLPLPKGNKLTIFCKNIGLNHFLYLYKIKNLDLDTLNLIFLQIKIQKEYLFINQFKVINYFENIRNSLYKKIISQTILEIIKKTIPINQKENKIFNLTLKFLEYLDKTKNDSLILHNFSKFLNLYIQNLGYQIPNQKDITKILTEIEKIANSTLNSKDLINEILSQKI